MDEMSGRTVTGASEREGAGERREAAGGFTMPGEAGYEELTLSLAKKWGADVVRDSDGSSLSDEILHAGYGIYSTICLIRGHNAFAREHPDALQQTFLVTEPVTAEGESLTVRLMDGYYREQFRVNDTPEALRYWQVFDRTAERLLEEDCWEYLPGQESVAVRAAVPWHEYMVSFLAYRIWEEISMYNHVTNGWGEREHLMPVDPMYEEVQEYLLRWMETWCEEHPETTVVRFTSMFYNFVWIWGESERRRNLFTDWGSYDFTVSVRALQEFERRYGYAMTAEDFIHQGKFHVTHMPPDQRKRDWMGFIQDFTIRFGKRLTETVHRHGKQAYMFYDDSWVGTEPYGSRFGEMGFDGIIKCVFSGYEVRLCAGVAARTHEIRLHPYLFPVGLNHAPTFQPGGDPARDARVYWTQVRRAMLYAPIQRIGLGGYLHLTEDFPDFVDYIAELAGEFRMIKGLLEEGEPLRHPVKIAVLHAWGGLRPWTLSGHFHETYMHELIHINEALAGMPFDVSFLDFADVTAQSLEPYQVVINAGRAGSAWSGGGAWKDDAVVERLTEWVHGGGVFLGVNEPSAVPGYHRYFRMSQVLGVDLDTGERVCHGAWPAESRRNGQGQSVCARERSGRRCVCVREKSADPGGGLHGPCSDGADMGAGELWGLLELPAKRGMYLTDGRTQVLREENGLLQASCHSFGDGLGIWLAGFEYTPQTAWAFERLLLLLAGHSREALPSTENPATQCAYYPESRKLVVLNNTQEKQTTDVVFEGQKRMTVELAAAGIAVRDC